MTDIYVPADWGTPVKPQHCLASLLSQGYIHQCGKRKRIGDFCEFHDPVAVEKRRQYQTDYRNQLRAHKLAVEEDQRYYYAVGKAAEAMIRELAPIARIERGTTLASWSPTFIKLLRLLNAKDAINR